MRPKLELNFRKEILRVQLDTIRVFTVWTPCRLVTGLRD